MSSFAQPFSLTASATGNRIIAPLTGSVTTGSWIVNQHQALANSPTGLGYMVYNVLLPAQYNPSFIYPALFVFHPDFDGTNNGAYPRDGNSFVSGTAYVNGSQSLNSLFNNVAFRTAFPAIIVACECDQALGDSDPNGNFGGYADAMPNSGWNERAVNATLATIINTYSVDSKRRYCIGYSLGAIGSLAYLVDNNSQNGPGLKLWTAGAGFSDQLNRPATPNTSVFSRMSTVPYFAVSTTSDNVPASYDIPAWQTYTGNSNYPSLNTYTSGGMAAVRAAATQFYYVNNGSGTPDQCIAINAIGGIGTSFYNWLFSQII